MIRAGIKAASLWKAPTRAHLGIAAVAVALALAGTVAWLVNKPPTADCSAEAPADHKVHEIRAAKVVVQPWLGEHRVYGIFMVPTDTSTTRSTQLPWPYEAWTVGLP